MGRGRERERSQGWGGRRERGGARPPNILAQNCPCSSTVSSLHCLSNVTLSLMKSIFLANENRSTWPVSQ